MGQELANFMSRGSTREKVGFHPARLFSTWQESTMQMEYMLALSLF